MKKLAQLTFILALFFSSCADKDSFVIKGTVTNDIFEGQYIFLQELDSAWDFRNPVNIDSTIISNGKFTFKGLAKSGSPVHFLYVSDHSDEDFINSPAMVILEPGEIEATLDSVLTVSGTPLNDAFRQINDKKVSIIREIFRLNKQVAADSTNTIAQEAMQKTIMMDWQGFIDNDMYEFIKSNIHNRMGAYLFSTWYDRYPSEKNDELMAGINSEYKSVMAIQAAELYLNIQRKTAVGATYTDLKGKTPDGKDIALSDYIGKNKLVLLDFWASWCKPCIEEMPNVMAAYREYHDKGFEVVGISLDESNDAWKKSVDKLGIPWPQMSDLKGWESYMVETYAVESIPFTILIDSDGKIIAKDLRGNDLTEKVSKALN
ncbi:MAG: AhpC/TSA family protein [Prevotella sp.]|jgi:peroxiredoxin|nr:AhpC/TSA family protein [Prevotella sp.]